MNFLSFVNLFKVENLVDKHIDELEFSNKDFFSKVITIRKEMASNLINDNEVVNEGIQFVNELVRSTVEIAVDLLLNLQDIIIKKNFVTKAVGAADFEKFAGALDRELEIAAIHNNERMWTTFGTSYGQGVERGLTDIGVTPEEVDWQKYRETAAYKETAYQSMRHIADGLSTRIKEVVAAGVAEGNGVYDIARRLREIKLGPKIVDVAPKIVNGKVTRRGYQYTINEKRYSNMIARTESSRAVNQGRLDAYNRTGIKNVEWLSAGDERVCDDCMDLDGRVFPTNNMPMIPYHVACRCTIVVSGKITDEYKLREVNDLSLDNIIVPDGYSANYHLSMANIKTQMTHASDEQLLKAVSKVKNNFKSIGYDLRFTNEANLLANQGELAHAFHAQALLDKMDRRFFAELQRIGHYGKAEIYLSKDAAKKHMEGWMQRTAAKSLNNPRAAFHASYSKGGQKYSFIQLNSDASINSALYHELGHPIYKYSDDIFKKTWLDDVVNHSSYKPATSYERLLLDRSPIKNPAEIFSESFSLLNQEVHPGLVYRDTWLRRKEVMQSKYFPKATTQVAKVLEKKSGNLAANFVDDMNTQIGKNKLSKQMKDKWVKLYDTNKDVKELMDSISYITQGYYSDYKNASVIYDKTRSIEKVNQALAKLRGKTALANTDYLASDMTVKSIKNVSFSSINDELTWKKFKSGFEQLDTAFEKSHVVGRSIYRGEFRSFAQLENMGRVGEKIDFGISSWTTDTKVARNFSISKGKGTIKYTASEREGMGSLVYKVDNAKGINVSGMSPYNQSEVLSKGRFEVIKSKMYFDSELGYEVKEVTLKFLGF